MQLYHRYVLLVDDLQNIFIRALMSMKPVIQSNVDDLFLGAERIRGLYSRAGATDEGMCEEWVVAAILQNLFDSIIKHLSTALMQARSVEET